ncbi:MAG: hypothetical protein RL033_4149 [Pseudomonadota bacterium]
MQRFVDVPRAMRVLASLSLLVAFARCSAEGESFDPVEGVEEPASLSVDESEAADPATELELGQLSEPLVSGAPCTAGTVACVSSSVAQRCLNGTVASFVCPAGSACSNGQCVVIQVCRPGATLGCSGNSRVVCNASGTNTIVTACAPGNTCAPGLHGQLAAHLQLSGHWLPGHGVRQADLHGPGLYSAPVSPPFEAG